MGRASCYAGFGLRTPGRQGKANGRQVSSSFFDGASQVAAPEKEPKNVCPCGASPGADRTAGGDEAQADKVHFVLFFAQKDGACLLK
jgi:hypothetical protein